MLRAKQNKEFKPEFNEQLEALVNEEIEQKTRDIVEYHKTNGLKIKDFTKEMFVQWMKHYEKDPVIIA